MLYTTLKIGDEEYKLRLTTGAMVDLEKKLGKNPLVMIAEAGKGSMPKLEEAMFILHYSLIKFQPNYKLKDTYNLYDRFVDDGQTFSELIHVLVDALSVSGYFRKKEKTEAKN